MSGNRSEIRSVGVVGCGVMGSGIAIVCAQAGYPTIIRETTPELVDRGLAGVRRQLDRLAEKERITADQRERIANFVRGTADLGELRACDIIIEAVVEDLAVKNDLWRDLDGICDEETIFASNTSSLTIADMAAATERPNRVLGLHFFNPVPAMKLVELVRTIGTDPAVFQRTRDFARSLGKEPIEAHDTSGFIVNRLLVPYLMDAIRALEQGVGSIEDIDRGMSLGAGHPMGPLTLCDFVGNDTLDRIGDIMFREYHEARYASPPLLRRMVAFGLFGRKSSKGFYDYTRNPPVPSDLGM
jgi:3-hydroxybutyryl-CoA dehydrogenase